MKVNYQILLSKKDPAPYLERWQGGSAVLSGYTSSHSVIQFRIYKEEKYLLIYCGDVQYIKSPAKWENARFEVEYPHDSEVILRDTEAGMEIKAGIVGIEER